jgi:hypothetical protein
VVAVVVVVVQNRARGRGRRVLQISFIFQKRFFAISAEFLSKAHGNHKTCW